MTCQILARTVSINRDSRPVFLFDVVTFRVPYVSHNTQYYIWNVLGMKFDLDHVNVRDMFYETRNIDPKYLLFLLQSFCALFNVCVKYLMYESAF